MFLAEPPPNRYRPLPSVLGAFACGIALERLLCDSDAMWRVVCLLLLVTWWVFHQARLDRVAMWILLAAVGCGGAAWSGDRWRLFPSSELGRHTHERATPVCLDVRVVRAPSVIRQQARPSQRSDRSRLLVQIHRVRDGAGWRQASGRGRLTVDGVLEDVAAGDQLRVWASLLTPASPGNPGGFDFAARERSERRLFLLRASHPKCVRVIERGAWCSSSRLLGQFREHAVQQLERRLSAPRANLARALLLGQRDQLADSQKDAFFRSGAIHLLAISGLHVGVLTWGVWLVGRLGMASRRVTAASAVSLALFYAVVTEAQPPVIRAAFFVCVVALGRIVGRPTDGDNTIAVAGLGVLLLNPADLFHTGVQLSFLAVTVLVRVGRRTPKKRDPLDRLIANSRPFAWRVLRRMARDALDLLIVSAAIYLVALPLVLARFHLASPLAVAINPLLTPPMTLALFSGIGVILFGELPLLGWLFGVTCEGSLAAMEFLVDTVAGKASAQWWSCGPPLWWLIGFYAGYGVLLLHDPWVHWRWWLCAVVVWLGVGLIADQLGSFQAARRKELRCTMLDVGHGNCVLIELPGGGKLLYDAGQLGMPESAARRVCDFLWSQRINRLDAVMISHTDTDHYNAIPKLSERFPIDRIYLPACVLRENPRAVRQLASDAPQLATRFVGLRAGQELTARCEVKAAWQADGGALQLHILHPPDTGVAGGDNANSLVLLVEYQQRRLLFPGDLEGEGLASLLASPNLDCDLVMAPHHGSARSHPSRFIAWCQPESVVASCGFGRSLAAVASACKARRVKFYHTARSGAVRVVIRNGEIDVRSWRERPW